MTVNPDNRTQTARTYAVSLYPDDIDIVRNLAARDFEYNESAAARFIIRKFAQGDPALLPQEQDSF